MIEFKPGRYVVGFWFLYRSPILAQQDFLAVVYRDGPKDKWRLHYRFRYYAEGSREPFDGKDEKSAYRGTFRSCPEKEMIQKMDEVVDKMAAEMRFTRDFLYVGSDDPAVVIDRLRSRPWVHTRIQEKERNP